MLNSPSFTADASAMRAEAAPMARWLDEADFFVFEIGSEAGHDQAALDAHRASPHYAEYAAGALLPLMVGRAAGRFQTVS